jgi:thiamine transport system ATP-binding protein
MTDIRERHPGGQPVRLDHAAFTYGSADMLFDADFPSSTITAVMGPSGSGKSTLLNLVAGFETPRKGRVLIGDSDVTALAPAERPVSMIFQENNLFAHLDVAKNVGLGRSPALRLTSDDRRVALARALVRDRPVLLLDEPFGSLGPALRQDMLDLLAGVQAERRMTVLFVTHQPEDARRLAQKIVFLEAGIVTAAGSTEEFFAGDGPEGFRRYVGSQS